MNFFYRRFCRNFFPGLFCAACVVLPLAACSKPAPQGGQTAGPALQQETARGTAAGGQTAPQSAQGSQDAPGSQETPGSQSASSGGPEFQDTLDMVLANAALPGEAAAAVRRAAVEGPGFIFDLLTVMAEDSFLYALVDKRHPLPSSYEPDDLVELAGPSYRAGREGLLLRKAAADALEEMGAAAKAGGITLLASSCYRSYSYQEEVYARNVRQSGQEQADRESARPGHSQHQLGLIVDFGSIDDSFAETAAGRWILVNASRFGWSLSYPQGYEEVTGYRWESWHYRYVGKELARFIDDYFGGIQQYALAFIHAWREAAEQ